MPETKTYIVGGKEFHSAVIDPGNPGQDKALLDKFYLLRSDIYTKANEVQFRTEPNEFDLKAKFIVYTDSNGEPIGGSRINTVEHGDKKTNLPFNGRQMKEPLKIILPLVNIFDIKRAEVSNIILKEEYRKGEFSGEHAKNISESSLALCMNKGVDIVFWVVSKLHDKIAKRIKETCIKLDEPAFSYKHDFGHELHLLGSNSTTKNILVTPLNKTYRDAIESRLKNGVDSTKFNEPSFKVKYGKVDLKNVKTIICDWDMTVVDSELAFAEAANYAINRMKAEDYKIEDQTELYEEGYKHSRILYGTLFKDPEIGKIAYEYSNAKYKDIHLEHTYPMKGAEDFLKFCQREKIRVIIASNKKTEFVLPELNHMFGHLKLNNIAVYGSAKKPESEWMEHALTDNSTHWIHALKIGDTLIYDALAALKLKMKYILIGERDLGDLKKLNTHPKNIKSLPNEQTEIGYEPGLPELHKALAEAKGVAIYTTEPETSINQHSNINVDTARTLS